jgi:DNA-binding winged helix-turn-helix (wHTH) protein
MRVSFGEFTLDTEERQLARRGSPVHLTPKALALLECLVAKGHGAVPKAELLARVWPATCVSEGSLTSVVKELRKALGDSARSPRYVRGVRGFGYAFCGEARVEPANAAWRPEFRVWWENREVALAEGENLLGRTHEAAVWVEHPGVSRRHALIRVAGAAATIEDCGSKNGTFVRGERVEGRRELRAGDEIWLGPALVRFTAYAGEATTKTHSGDPRRR